MTDLYAAASDRRVGHEFIVVDELSGIPRPALPHGHAHGVRLIVMALPS